MPEGQDKYKLPKGAVLVEEKKFSLPKGAVLSVEDEKVEEPVVQKKSSGLPEELQDTFPKSDSEAQSTFQKTKLTEEEEKQFQQWWNSDPNILAWRGEFIKDFGGEPPMETPYYDYRGAWRAGITPRVESTTGKMRWDDPGGLKSPEHPTAWKSDFVSKYGINPDDPLIDISRITDPILTEQPFSTRVDRHPLIDIGDVKTPPLSKEEMAILEKSDKTAYTSLGDFLKENNVSLKDINLDEGTNLQRKLRPGETDAYMTILDMKGLLPEKPTTSYFWGTVRAINEGTVDFFRTLDNASTFISDVTGFKKGGAFGDIANMIEMRTGIKGTPGVKEEMPETPENTLGYLLRDVGHLEGLFLELAITPEFKWTKVVNTPAGRQALKFAVPKLFTQMTGSGFVNRYGEVIKRDPEGMGKWVEGLKGAGVGAKNATVLLLLGYGSGKLATAVKGATGSAAMAAVSQPLSMYVGFGGSNALEQLITTGKVDEQQALRAANMGLALGIPAVAQYIGGRAMTNYFMSSQKAEIAARQIKTPIEELREKAASLREEGRKKESFQERVEFELKANALDNIADIKVVSEEVIKNPKFFEDVIKKAEDLPEEQKQIFLNKIKASIGIKEEGLMPEELMKEIEAQKVKEEQKDAEEIRKTAEAESKQAGKAGEVEQEKVGVAGRGEEQIYLRRDEEQGTLEAKPGEEVIKEIPEKDVLGKTILTAEEWNKLAPEEQEKRSNAIDVEIKDSEKNTIKVDYNIAPFLKRIFNLGIVTDQSDSGTISDHPGYRYIKGKEKGEIIKTSRGYITFLKPEALDSEYRENINKINSKEDIEIIRESAKETGIIVEDGKGKNKDLLIVRMSDSYSDVEVLKKWDDFIINLENRYKGKEGKEIKLTEEELKAIEEEAEIVEVGPKGKMKVVKEGKEIEAVPKEEGEGLRSFEKEELAKLEAEIGEHKSYMEGKTKKEIDADAEQFVLDFMENEVVPDKRSREIRTDYSDLNIQTRDLATAKRNILEGKTTKTAERIKELIKGWYKDGYIPTLQGSGGHELVKGGIPVKDMIEFMREAKKPLSGRDALVESGLSEWVKNKIETEGITLENIDRLKADAEKAMRGFDYKESEIKEAIDEYNEIKEYLENEAKGIEKEKPVEAEERIAGKGETLEERKSEAKAKISEGVEDFAKALDIIKTLEGEERPDPLAAMRKIAEGVYELGAINIEEFIQNIKKYITDRFSDKEEQKRLLDFIDQNSVEISGIYNEIGKERKFATKLMKDPSISPEIKRGFLEDRLNYIPKGEDIGIKVAELVIEAKGVDGAIRDFMNFENDYSFDSRVRLGQALIVKLNSRALDTKDPKIKEKSFDDATIVAEELMEFGTKLGRGVQAFASWYKLSPEGLLFKIEKDLKKQDIELTPKQKAKFAELAERVKKAPEGYQKQEAIQDLLKEELRIKGIRWDQVGMSVWYAHILSGFRTQELNVFANIAQTAGELLTSITYQPKNTPKLLKGLYQGWGRGLIEAWAVLKTGYAPVKSVKQELTKLGEPGTLEAWQGVKLPGNGIRIFKKNFQHWNPFILHKYVTRVMNAADTWSYHGLKEMRFQELANLEGRRRGLRGRALDKYVSEKLHRTKERKIAAKEQAHNEYIESPDFENNVSALIKMKPSLSRIDAESQVKKQFKNTANYRRRMWEIMELGRPIDYQTDTHDFASRGTFNYPTEGALGRLTDAIANYTQNVPIGRFVVPFTKIVSNVANAYLDWSPYGYYRGIKGGVGSRKVFESKRITEKSKYSRKFTPEQRAKEFIKASTGTLAALTVYALTRDEEGNGYFDVTGNGTGDYKKNYELKEGGWLPYSIKIGDKWYSYQNTPLAVPLAIIGNIRDLQEYTDYTEENIAKKTEIVLWNTFKYFTDFTFLRGLSEFLSSFSEDNPKTATNYFERFTRNILKGFVTPNIVTQVSRQIQSVYHMSMKEANKLHEHLIRDYPIARRGLTDMVNALGEPVIADTDRWTSDVEYDPVWDVIIKNKAWIGKPSKYDQVYDYELGQDKKLTPDEYYEYCKLRGQMIRTGIEERLEDFKEYSPSEIREEIQQIKSNATISAKYELFGPK